MTARDTPSPSASPGANIDGAGGETGWLVESDENGPLYQMASGSTRDASKALRFCRREDAEAFIGAHGPNHLTSIVAPAWRAAEHRWG